jgi:hypothetical protein
MRRYHPGMAILIGGLVAGILDITAAILVTLWYGGSPVRMLQGIASAAIGKSAFDGGMQTALIGLAFHFLIAYTATAVFYLASRKIRFLTEQPVVAGLLYGIAVYCFMFFVVQPLAGIHPKFTMVSVPRSVIVHMLCVGLPIALVVKKWSGGLQPAGRSAA